MAETTQNKALTIWLKQAHTIEELKKTLGTASFNRGMWFDFRLSRRLCPACRATFRTCATGLTFER